jgi:hypothetical protein
MNFSVVAISMRSKEKGESFMDCAQTRGNSRNCEVAFTHEAAPTA